jgi:hypothetical protein
LVKLTSKQIVPPLLLWLKRSRHWEFNPAHKMRPPGRQTLIAALERILIKTSSFSLTEATPPELYPNGVEYSFYFLIAPEKV